MGYALVTESLLEDIGDAIREKTGGNANLTLAQMASAISGLSSKPIQYRLGTFEEDPAGGAVSSITFSVSANAGEKCLLVVMHRASVDTPNSWSLVHCTKNENFDQWISIFSKYYSSDAVEAVTVSKTDSSNTARMCGASIYFNKDISLESPIRQTFDNSTGTYSYTVQKSDDIYLCVVNNAYAGSSIVTVSPIIKKLPDTSNSITCRLCIFVAGTFCENMIWNASTVVNSADYSNNRLFLYKIT